MQPHGCGMPFAGKQEKPGGRQVAHADSWVNPHRIISSGPCWGATDKMGNPGWRAADVKAVNGFLNALVLAGDARMLSQMIEP